MKFFYRLKVLSSVNKALFFFKCSISAVIFYLYLVLRSGFVANSFRMVILQFFRNVVSHRLLICFAK